MVRSVGIAALVAGLAWTGLAGAQSSSPGTAASGARYLFVSEEGRPDQRCRVLKTWHEANGVPAFQVQAVDTGEMMTIISSGPTGAGGDPRAMSTRIFRWGRDNKPPAGVPLPPPTATVLTPPPTLPAPMRVEPIRIVPPPVQPSQLTATPKPILPPLPLRKTESTPAPAPKQPAIVMTPGTNTRPMQPVVVSQPKPVVPSKPALTPMSTQIVQYSSAPKTSGSTPPPSTTPQPRLVPTTSVMTSDPKSSCACSSPCTSCQPCAPCSKSSCVTCTPSPLRQKFMTRLFKSNSASSCSCTEIASKPATNPTTTPAAPPVSTIAKAPIEPAKPGDWRESWGKTEPWKTTSQVTSNKPVKVVSRRVEPMPVRIDPPKQPDPIKAPDQFREMAMSARPANSKVPQEKTVSRPIARLLAAKQPAAQQLAANRPPVPELLDHPIPDTVVHETVIVHTPQTQTQRNGVMPAAAPNTQPPGRVIQLAADEPNAFWSPAQPKKPEAGQEQPRAKVNAFDRDPNDPPPQGMPQGMPPRMGQVARLPVPPSAPQLMLPPQPPMPPSMPDVGVASAMGNAFTLPGTRRPIPADFGGTPQESNGFDPMVQGGQGTPPQAYGMSMGVPAMSRYPMPNMMAVAMAPRGPMGINPLMSVPPTLSDPSGTAPVQATAPAAGVPQLVAALKDSLYPSEREAAVEKLSELDWHSQPMVVESLMKSAREDPAATVRAACIHALASMKVDTPGAVALVRSLKSDRDPRVRQEAEAALGALGDSGIQQASHK